MGGLGLVAVVWGLLGSHLRLQRLGLEQLGSEAQVTLPRGLPMEPWEPAVLACAQPPTALFPQAYREA